MNEQSSTLTLGIDTARILKPLLQPSRYKALYGGRGSMKSHFFAELGIEMAVVKHGFRMVCVREVQKDLMESAKHLIETKIEILKLGSSFRCLNNKIETPGGGVIIFQGMTDYTAESIKSLEGFDVAWVEEAQTLSERSLELLRPTIRNDESELWFGWNPRNPEDPVDQLFRGLNPPKNSIIQKVNYKDNPWFPRVMEEERLHDEINNRDRYAHIWLGEYEPVAVGAIWDRQTIHRNRRSIDSIPQMNRIVVAIDPTISNNSKSDEHGIIVVGIGDDQRGYVLDDLSLHGMPRQWATRALAAYDKWEADAIVVEINQGGDMVKDTIRSVREEVNIIEVRATKGKHVRAEPVSSLYSLNKISHVGTFTKLEDQMCKMTARGYEGQDSPDRLDAMIWGFTETFDLMTVKKPDDFELVYIPTTGWL